MDETESRTLFAKAWKRNTAGELHKDDAVLARLNSRPLRLRDGMG
jgi:hypothetical protein